MNITEAVHSLFGADVRVAKLLVVASLRYTRIIVIYTYRCFRQRQEPEVGSAPREAGIRENHAETLEVALADASTLSQAHYALGRPSRSPKTRRPVHLFSPPGIVPRKYGMAHRTIFNELSITRFEKLQSQILVLHKLCLEYQVHCFDVHFKPVRSLVGTLKSCFGACSTCARLCSYKFGQRWGSDHELERLKDCVTGCH